MGLFTLSLAGCGFLVMGALEALTLNPTKPKSPSSPSSSSSSTSLSSFTASLLSLIFIVNSTISLLDAITSHDPVGSALQLQFIAVAALFLLHSTLTFTNPSLPSPLLHLTALFAFLQEFLIFYLQKKDPSGIENRYFDLLLLPIAICVFSTILSLRSTQQQRPSNLPVLSRAIALILQGTWLIQMGFSFHSSFIAHGCFLVERSRGNYTVRCKGHPDYHRARAIATLQFNCHLALIVVLVVAFYGLVAGKSDEGVYSPLGGGEVKNQLHEGRFTLDSDDEIKEEEKRVNGAGAAVQLIPLHNGDGES